MAGLKGVPTNHGLSAIAPTLEILHRRQDEYGYLHEEHLQEAAASCGLTTAELYSAVTAYPRFRLSPNAVKTYVCAGPACRMKGGEQVATKLAAAETHCLGLCDQPVAILTEQGPRIWAEPPTLPAIQRPVIGVAESAFFDGQDTLQVTQDALKRPADEIIAVVAASGLLGRGGAAFPASHKWQMVRAATGSPKFVICNADESEPGTFKDRYLLDHAPERLLGGMVVAGHAVGARWGVVYIRYEYGPQYQRLVAAVERLRAVGLLGERFDIVVRRGAGSYVCGEETALLNSLEGKRPIPRDRPPYPTERGLYGLPTLVHNVETLAAIPAIVSRGADWFRSVGRPKLYCVSGDVPSPGVFELAMDTTVSGLLEMAGVDTAGVKAFTLGGVSGGLLPPSAGRLALDTEAPKAYGAALGSAGVIVLGPSRCPVRFAREGLRFFVGESCGKCFPCRIGTTRLQERLDAMIGLRGIDTGEAWEIVDVLAVGSACGLGQAAGLLVQHLLKYFADEVHAHCQGRCPAGECEADGA